MPKPRKTATAQQYFSLTPWQNKNEKPQREPDPGGCDYSVVQEDIIVKQSPAADARNSSDQMITEEPKQPSPSGWRTKGPKTEEEPSPLLDEGDVITTPYDEDLDSPAGRVSPSHPPSPSAVAHSPRPIALTGTAFIVIFGGTRLVGNFTVDASPAYPSRSYPLHGREITSYRECTRDPEWTVCELIILGLPGGMPQELKVLAESTGGDALRLRGPVDWQGAEAEVAAELSQGCCEGIEVEFDCHTLLADAAADAELQRVMPQAVGLGGMVNIGPMKVKFREESGGDGGGVEEEAEEF